MASRLDFGITTTVGLFSILMILPSLSQAASGADGGQRCLPGNLANATKVSIPSSAILQIGQLQQNNIRALSQAAQKNLGKLKTSIHDNRAFSGLYFIGSASQGTLPGQHFHQGYLGIEWQVFRRGYFEGHREEAIGSAESLIDAYKINRNLQQQSGDQALYEAKAMENRVLFDLSRKILSAQKELTGLYQKRVKAGYETRQALSQQKAALQNAKSALRLYRYLPEQRLSNRQAHLIDHIGSLQLAPLNTLSQDALKHSNVKQLQHLFKHLARLTTPTWSRYITLGLYAQRGYGLQWGNQIGVRFSVPIGGNLGAGQIVSHREEMRSLQLSADKVRLREQVISLVGQIANAENQLSQLQSQYASQLDLAQMNCTEKHHIVPSLKDTPEKKLEQMKVVLLQQQRSILKQRFSVYKLLIQLRVLVQPHQAEAWYSIQ